MNLSWIQKWGFLVAAAITYRAVEAPLRIAFGYGHGSVLVALDVACFLIFAVDILQHFFAPICQRGRWVHSRRQIAATYLRGWFVADLLGSLPFYYLSFWFPTPLVSWMEWLYLLRLPRLWQLTKKLNLRHSTFFIARRLAILFFWILLAVHVLACGWTMVGGGGEAPDSWTMYLRSFYWTVTTLSTIGYGDITPQNNTQMLFAIFTMATGVGVYAVLIGNVASLLARGDGARLAHEEKLERLNAFMNYKKVPLDLRRRIMDYHAYLWESGLGYDENSLLEELPRSLRNAVYLFLNKEIIEKVPVFQKANAVILRELMTQMKLQVFTPGDYILLYGEVGKAMYFISRGKVEVLSEDQKKPLAILGEGEYFGEAVLLRDTTRTATVRALDFCHLYVLEKSAFEMVMKEFSDFAAYIKSQSRKEHQQK
ncbi:MAG: ion transporter [bacterium]